MKRAWPVVALALIAVAVAPGAATKEGARARLTAAVAITAPPGSAIRVEWRVDAPDENGARRPFGAMNMFVRLLSRTGAQSTSSFARQSAGRYSAQAKVPVGGVGGIRAGLRGTTDIFFPLENSPFRTASGVTCDAAALRRTLAAFVGAYNRGDLRRLDRLFSRANFVWYSAGAPGPRFQPDAGRRGTLIRYFGERHRRGDRLELTGYRFNGYERERVVGHFELRARRRADGFRGGDWFRVIGKGALDCSKSPVTIAVLSLGEASR